MSTGQTLLTIGAFVLLTTILQGVYGSLGDVGRDIARSQDGILATSIATSYCEYAYGLAYDQITDTSDVALASPATLTYPPGREAGEDSLCNFNDIDDLNGWFDVKIAGGSGRKYQTGFTVSYVDTNDVSHAVNYRTYIKRLDMKTWRIYPLPLTDETIDTLKTSIVMGYFHFN
jgi:MSHA pilin protein MshD